jgi:hypothetical protein
MAVTFALPSTGFTILWQVRSNAVKQHAKETERIVFSLTDTFFHCGNLFPYNIIMEMEKTLKKYKEEQPAEFLS